MSEKPMQDLKHMAGARMSVPSVRPRMARILLAFDSNRCAYRKSDPGWHRRSNAVALPG